MIILNLIIFIGILYIIYIFQKKGTSLAKRIGLAFIFGILLGIVFQVFYRGNDIIHETLSWTDIIGNSYIRLLLMIVMPLISISLFSAILNLNIKENIFKNTSIIILLLLFGSFLGAIFGISSTLLFGLDVSSLQHLSPQGNEIQNLLALQSKNISISLQQRMTELVPINLFADLAGLRQTSAIGVVIFSLIAGSAALGLKLRKPEKYETFTHLIQNLRSIVLRITKMIVELTPYAVFSLITALVSTQNLITLMPLINFIMASYVAILGVFFTQLLILRIAQVNVGIYLKKAFSVLIFGFVNRNTAGSLPLSINTLKTLGVKERYASITASLGLSIGQAGCAGVYPAMLAMMMAPMMGIDPLNIYFILKVIFIVIITSFGIAGVGGGATAAALMVLPILGFPIFIVGILMVVEPIIDMARTALNINNNLVAGILTSKIIGEFDNQILLDKENIIKNID